MFDYLFGFSLDYVLFCIILCRFSLYCFYVLQIYSLFCIFFLVLSFILNCIALCLIALYCIALYLIAFYCILLYSIPLKLSFFNISYRIVLYYFVLSCVVVFCILLYFIVIFCIVLYFFILHCILLYFILLFNFFIFHHPPPSPHTFPHLPSLSQHLPNQSFTIHPILPLSSSTTFPPPYFQFPRCFPHPAFHTTTHLFPFPLSTHTHNLIFILTTFWSTHL